MTNRERPLDVPPVVTVDWVASRTDEVILADVRWYLDGRSGRDAYLAEHLPCAIWVDVDTDLSDPPTVTGGQHPLPTPEEFAKRLGDLGIGDDTLVVAYDDQGGGFAARLVWLLRRTGQRAALLDGGLHGWPGRRESGPVTRPPVARSIRPWPAELLRDAHQVQAAAASPRAVVLDARAPGRYAGTEALPGETRTGHIPGALSAPWAANVNDQGSFYSADELRSRFGELGVTHADEVIVYCGSGITACHDLLAMERAGLAPGALYPGSWSAWSGDQTLPMARGNNALEHGSPSGHPPSTHKEPQ